MVHRPILTERQRNDLMALPSDESSMLSYYILSDEDIIRIKRKQDAHNRLGFALQLCALRYPGRYLHTDDVLPKELIDFVGAQIGLSEIQLLKFTYKSVTRYEHLRALQQHYGYLPFHRFEAEFIIWLKHAAIETRNNAELATLFVQECRKRRIILPGITVIERLCADARLAAEREIVGRIASRLDERMKKNLHAMLEETVDGRLTIHGWLKRFEVGHNSADVNRLLEKLEYLQELDIPESLLDGIPTHRVIWLQQQGEAYYADGLRDIKEERQMAILATCAIQWKAMIIDAVLETHDRIVGKVYSDCKRMRDDQLIDHKKLANETLISFVQLGKKLLKAHATNGAVADVIQSTDALEMLIMTAKALTKKLGSEPLEFVLLGYGKFRRYTQRMLEDIIFEGNQAAQPLLDAIELLKALNQSEKQANSNLPICFANPKWCKRMGNDPERKLWETALLFAIRDGLRSRDIWVNDSCTHRDTSQQLLPIQQAEQTVSLPIPLQPDTWLAERQALLEEGIKQVSRMIRQGTLPNSYIEKGKIRVNRLDRQLPEGMDTLTLDIYKQMPEISITDILTEVDEDTGFTDNFTHVHTGSPCSDKVGLLNVLLAGGINMGLKKMALCSSSHPSFWSLMRISSWYVTSESMTDALAVIIEKHKNLPLSAAWGDGTTSSSDGQFFFSGGVGEAMNVVNAKQGFTPGFKGYTHLSGQYGPFAIRTIPATAHEAPYILDGLTMNDTGKRIKEHYADTGGFTDHVFAMCALLGYQFAPRLRNLSSLRLYSIKGISIPKAMKEPFKVKASIARIEQQWPNIIRLVASIMTHKVIPSDILRQLASFPRQNELAIALREIGRIERTIFILNWISSVALQRRAQMGLNKGEAHHALKRALNFNRRGEITDRTSENQHLRMMHLNLLTAIIIYWNTKHLGRIIHDMKQQGIHVPPEKLAHLSPLGWEHIILTGFYKW
ncbi:Tn3 family transposase [Candidatus Odyssella thessalonicensis]|uniref:Tn3 family transposase n=1 Tax=Candidatus Odyssella thessalonicensis TaxID=84647 RepID=UPI000225ACC5|nr:Tn3 family transposase [Candidatus Odyssella thessalonicensis]